ncbi:hypothetical protein [Halomonas sp. TD01]|uniref:hypothetical protein n=1 Tax=Halomonas sp. TD01 TaxID=999141 RepID=UPI000214F5F8|nr:hypothetical protein [Halomonas sp. TD01]EGP18354.1 hypothetical protein GME_16827 [Halomonas sp. TD01]CAH1044313.1 hypothetical protein HPTD01_2791 [Halomonas sp. TD01]
MKIIFALTLGTIALLLAVTAQDSLIARIFLAAVGLAIYAVVLIPGAARKASGSRQPDGPTIGEFSDRSQKKPLKLQKELF